MKKNIIDIITNNFTEEEQILLLKELVKELKEEHMNYIDDTDKIINKIVEINKLCDYMNYHPQYIFAIEKIEDMIYKVTYKNVTGGIVLFPNTIKGSKEHKEYLQNQSVIKTRANHILDESYYIDIDNFLEKTYDKFESGYPKVANEEDRKKQIISFRKKELDDELQRKGNATVTVHCPPKEDYKSKVYKK